MNDQDYSNESNHALVTRNGGSPATNGPLNVQPSALALQTSQLAMQERMADVQMRYISARQFPRDIVRVEQTVRNACQRYGLASIGEYLLPVGQSKVRGPSIRLAEVLAQNYGNIDVGTEVVSMGKDDKAEYTDVRVFAIDLESGYREQEVIRIHHVRVSKDRATNTVKYTHLTDLSEVQRALSQHTAKRKRQCILAVIPRDLTDKAIEWCRATVQAGEKGPDGKPLKPLFERCKGMALEFERVGVTRTQLEKFATCKMELWTQEHFADLIGAFRSIRDGHATAEEFFGDPNATDAGDTAARMRAQVAAKKNTPATPAAPAQDGEAK